MTSKQAYVISQPGGTDQKGVRRKIAGSFEQRYLDGLVQIYVVIPSGSMHGSMRSILAVAVGLTMIEYEVSNALTVIGCTPMSENGSAQMLYDRELVSQLIGLVATVSALPLQVAKQVKSPHILCEIGEVTTVNASFVKVKPEPGYSNSTYSVSTSAFGPFVICTKEGLIQGFLIVSEKLAQVVTIYPYPAYPFTVIM